MLTKILASLTGISGIATAASLYADNHQPEEEIGVAADGTELGTITEENYVSPEDAAEEILNSAE